MPLGAIVLPRAFVIIGRTLMDKETKEMKLAYWTGIIKESKSSGMKISDWCRMNQISRRQYYYWHRKVMHDTYETAVERGLLPGTEADPASRDLPIVPEFAELTAPASDKAGEHCGAVGISIRWNDFTVTVSPKFSEGELAKVLRVMKNA